jgi:hypothetical protein
MRNPFYIQEIPIDAPFCNRAEELKELQSYGEAKANVVLYSPRRYGKTSLIKRVQKRLARNGAVTIFTDFFGVGSVEDVAVRMAKAVFAVTHGNDPLWKTALRTILSFRPVIKPDADGGISLSVEAASAGKSGLELLDETMASLGQFINGTKNLVNIVLDEFQEIITLRDALKIEASLRSHIQQHPASYFFVGSRRRVLLGIFNERQRPFFQSAINYPLRLLPPEDLGKFIVEQFRAGRKRCPHELGLRISSLVGYHPYYAQKLSFFVFEIAGKITERTIQEGLERLVLSEKPVFETIIQGLSPHQRLLLKALAIEPTEKILASGYIQKHRLGSVGGLQHSKRQLADFDLIEKDEVTGLWQPVDPILSMWLKKQLEEKLSGKVNSG